MASSIPPLWPTKHNVLGVQISAVNYDQAVEAVTNAARCRQPSVVSLHAVHALVTASRSNELREAVNQFQLIAPDGQPVRWALNYLHSLKLKERVYGPELMLRLCQRAAEEEISIYLYGSTQDVIDMLRRELLRRFPRLEISGAEAPPFRELTVEEDGAVVQRINSSGAGILFVGLGAPKQDLFAHAHRDRIHAVQVCVGAAFDFHAGLKAMAPVWMQKNGLEWLFRLIQEPRRLWRRYLVTNALFVSKIAVAAMRRPHSDHLATKIEQIGDRNGG